MSIKYNKRIILVGMPDMALVCLAKLVADKINIIASIPPHKSHNTYKLFCNFAKNLDIPVIDYEISLKDKNFLERIKNYEPDLAVVCSYGKLFPPELLQTTKDGFINVHPSLLPKYRGANPYSHVIINGEKETGVTLHYMDEHFDTGDIVAQKKIKIYEKDTMGTIFNRLNYLGADMLSELLTKYEKGEKITRIKQPEGNYVKAPAIDAESTDVLINWNKTAVETERFIRALNPFINAGTRYRGNYIKIHTAEIENTNSDYAPGTIVSINNTLAVACKKGILHIKILQAGSYFIGSSIEFIRLSGCKTGEIFE